MKFFNIFISSANVGHYEIVLNEEQVQKVFDDINNKLPVTWIKGNKIDIAILNRVELYSIMESHIGEINQEDLEFKIRKQIQILFKGKINLDTFQHYGVNVTDSYFSKSQNRAINANKPKSGKIFISHSHRDSEIVQKFSDVILSNALNLDLSKNIFCTSIDGSKPNSGEDFRNRIKEELSSASLVLQFISNNYKSSEVCLNEMGAAWVLSSHVVPLVIEQYDIGFIHSTTQQVMLDSETDLHGFIELVKKLGIISDINMPRCNTKVKEFVSYITAFNAKNEGTQNIDVINIAESNLKERNPFFRINNHSNIYIKRSTKYHEIPDTATLNILGYQRYSHSIHIELGPGQLKNEIGAPVQSVYNGEIWIVNNDPKVWLSYNGKRHHVLNVETLVKLKEYKVTQKLVDALKLMQLPQGDSLDLK